MATIAVAIDGGKTSKAALKWTVDNIVSKSQSQPVTLVYVRCNAAADKRHGGAARVDMNNYIVTAGNQQLNSETEELFRSFFGYCKRKNVKCNTIVLDAASQADIPKALIEYVKAMVVEILVVGSSGKSGFVRQFSGPEIASVVSKLAPTFCTVHVVAKGKLSHSRMSSSSVPPKPPAQSQPAHAHTVLSRNTARNAPERAASSPVKKDMEGDEIIRSPFSRPGVSPYRPMVESDISFVNHDKPEFRHPADSFKGQFSSSSDEGYYSSSSGGSSLASLSSLSSSSQSTPVSGRVFSGTIFKKKYIASEADRVNGFRPQDDLEAEMRRLMLELKHTKEMYTAAVKEAHINKQANADTQDWRFEQRRLQRTQYSEEAARALAEKERERYKAALEAAAAARRIAEIEAQKRKEIEMRGLVQEKPKASAEQHMFRYMKYSYEEIEKGTQYFSESNKIGEGGYGPVYKGYLDHTPVAIKILRSDAAEGQSQFQQEVEVLSCIRHPNMVLLLGACPEKGTLVYEYMEKGSLEDCLFRKGNTPVLPWQLRFRIAAEITTGLLFLHHAKPEPLVHRDLKPGNILLNRNYVAKISDVGLARLVPPSVANQVTQCRMTSAAGTFCYIDPEYQQTCMLSTKSDVYSLGIMLLQIITAKPPMGLAHRVEMSIEDGTFATILDPSIPSWPLDAALKFAKIALQCAELRRRDRPDLEAILPELNRLRELGEQSMFDLMS
uniref:RING-type E3 ubiquitin transferase n=1 Tax=Kalanchoe fedtschenkoi TaxID=63787 RepID=A0A7N0R8Y2_KALFE